jgi:hypothetical protein
MKADLSRETFAAEKHLAGLLVQQGRVPIDADPNEQLAIQLHRDYTAAEDVIGPCGAPTHEAGFMVQPTPDGQDLIISPGRFYVHGRMCELEATPVAATWQSATDVTVDLWHVDGMDFAPNQYVELSATGIAPAVFRIQAAAQSTRQLTLTASVAAFQNAAGLELRRLTTYLTQPDLPDPPFATAGPQPKLDLPGGAYIVYLDVWPRHLTALDDESIREKALGGPDTATRIKTVWQLKLWPGPDDDETLGEDTGCNTATGWDDLVAPPTGRVNARTKPGPVSDDPCVLPPGAGYLGLENQLYRIEIHEGGVLGTNPITFVWSRDNGSVATPIVPIPGTASFTVDTGPDDVLGLANGQWVEQVDDAVELNAMARDLFQFQIDPVTSAVTLNFPAVQNRHPQLRRWDSPDKATVPWPPVGDGWLDIEDNIQVRFEPGTYRRGDYWLMPARTVLGDIEWPRDGAGQPVPQRRRGVRHEYCRVGVLHVSGGGALQVDDCRPLFPPLVELKKGYTCCTFTVGDGAEYAGDFTLIQEAVDHLPADGGQICLYPGTYVENVRIEGKRNVHIRGCGRRSRVVSGPPNADGIASAVFLVLGSERVKLESFSIEAAETAPGVLVAGERPSRGIILERLGVTARRDSAIKVRDAEDVLIDRCRIAMLDGNGGWPGIFLRAVDAAVRHTVVRGTLVGLEPRRVLQLPGALAVSALQLGGGCERVRVHENLFQGCSGQGITLGSQVEVDLEGRPVGPSGGGGWVADRHDPCFPCEDPTTGDRPPGEGGEEPPTRLESEGDLYDIDIRRNRIFDMGLDGIGVSHFFDFRRERRALGLVRVVDLAIVENRIQRCVRRAMAPIPASMSDLMAYGGIALSVTEGVVIRDNRIEDLGFGGLLPTCGIFLFYGEGVEIGRNHILNGGMLRALPEAFALPGRRGGIHVAYALGLEVATPTDPAAPTATTELLVATGSPGGIRRLGVALLVEENSVDVARGQALAVGALGPVSVVSNRFISRGLVRRDQSVLLRAGPAGAGPLTTWGALVSIANLGSAWGTAGVANFAMAATGTHAAGLAAPAREVGSGNVLFDDNQCTLDVSADAVAGETGSLPPSIVVLSLDDAGFQDNQCDCVIGEGLMPVATLILALSQRAVSNRFKETLGRVFFSAITFGWMNTTTQNQANHCLWILGTLLNQDQPNQILANVLQPGRCPDSQRRLLALLAGALSNQ